MSYPWQPLLALRNVEGKLMRMAASYHHYYYYLVSHAEAQVEHSVANVCSSSEAPTSAGAAAVLETACSRAASSFTSTGDHQAQS
jgi:hypothetical protein